MGQPEELLFPALAAEALGVSPATLRRYAQAWEKAFGPLPRAPGGGRLWPRPALARLKAARELAQRDGLPLEEALLRVEGEAPLVATAHPRRRPWPSSGRWWPGWRPWRGRCGPSRKRTPA
jgi:hypothetical protein